MTCTMQILWIPQVIVNSHESSFHYDRFIWNDGIIFMAHTNESTEMRLVNWINLILIKEFGWSQTDFNVNLAQFQRNSLTSTEFTNLYVSKWPPLPWYLLWTNSHSSQQTKKNCPVRFAIGLHVIRIHALIRFEAEKKITAGSNVTPCNW